MEVTSHGVVGPQCRKSKGASTPSIGPICDSMLISLPALLVALRSIFRSRLELQLENLALRQQIGVLQRSGARATLGSGARNRASCVRASGRWAASPLRTTSSLNNPVFIRDFKLTIRRICAGSCARSPARSANSFAHYLNHRPRHDFQSDSRRPAIRNFR
jgi:hypothetical protein